MRRPLLAHSYGTGAGSSDSVSLCCVAGTIPREMTPVFERTAYRLTRGNCIVHTAPIDDPLLSGAAPGTLGWWWV